ncbi:hypothetical protein [Pseudomonas aeruginosa]|uniref:hypothetical protein n=1 Tax=Pseudomonas aeruginosa TaxID=287 RepID=UPI00287F2F41|nr:hypothetical protein [Pseudomonas aeruginosa]MDS9748111.1 hypothetical protein [Pseudomonas aeruginosa]MDS9771937.1 hypothetical protein [Pseudomonas aeruginosa]MDS9798617.1 hypothetical protein [Pseudomonas aeruginosa]
MASKSFKQMIKDGDLKRADAMKARLEDLHEEPGFNLRAEGEDLEQSIADLADYLHQGGIVPALEVRPREEGGSGLSTGTAAGALTSSSTLKAGFRATRTASSGCPSLRSAVTTLSACSA